MRWKSPQWPLETRGRSRKGPEVENTKLLLWHQYCSSGKLLVGGLQLLDELMRIKGKGLGLLPRLPFAWGEIQLTWLFAFVHSVYPKRAFSFGTFWVFLVMFQKTLFVSLACLQSIIVACRAALALWSSDQCIQQYDEYEKKKTTIITFRPKMLVACWRDVSKL